MDNPHARKKSEVTHKTDYEVDDTEQIMYDEKSTTHHEIKRDNGLWFLRTGSLRVLGSG
jgi:hypothetical protein